MNRIHRLAVAGAWGYIGRKFVDAGLDLGLDVAVLDPGPAPDDLDLQRLRRVDDADAFYAGEADLFHLALHPEHRDRALDALLRRAVTEPLAILNEKPMAAPERPADCGALIDALSGTRALLLFDFPELFDPLTTRVLEILSGFDRVEIDEVVIQRSKDREDPANRRNDKRMVHIQYQETVHCLAWLLFVLGHLRGGAESLLADGVRVAGESWPYVPPNPEAYPYVVDGKVEYRLQLGSTQVQGRTDFKRGASWAKTRRVRGRADGRPFELDMDYLEGAKRLSVRLGDEAPRDQGIDPAGSSYEGVLVTFDRWLTEADPDTLRGSTRFPTPAFAHLTYQLSSLLWRSCHEGRTLEVTDAPALRVFDAGFADAVPGFGRYGGGPVTSADRQVP